MKKSTLPGHQNLRNNSKHIFKYMKFPDSHLFFCISTVKCIRFITNICIYELLKVFSCKVSVSTHTFKMSVVIPAAVMVTPFKDI